jgi:RNA polymerase sigma-70 factor (ECF subfamily)
MTGKLAATDEQLVAQYQASGQSQDLEELVQRHLPRVHSIVDQIVLDPSVAEDLTQEAFLKAFQQLGKFRGEARFGTWLYRIAVNTAYTYLRRNQRSPVEFRDEVEAAGGEQDPDARLLTAELDGEIQAALAALSPTLRAAIVLTSFQELAVSEVAEIENCTTQHCTGGFMRRANSFAAGYSTTWYHDRLRRSKTGPGSTGLGAAPAARCGSPGVGTAHPPPAGGRSHVGRPATVHGQACSAIPRFSHVVVVVVAGNTGRNVADRLQALPVSRRPPRKHAAVGR